MAGLKVSLWQSLEGHQLTLKPLVEAASQNRLAATMLFAGPGGIGKKLAGLTLAQALVCETARDRRGDGAGCGTCGPCLRIEKGQSESLMVIEPDGAQIKVDQAREILQFLNLQKLGRARVIIIDQAHLLGAQAGNALLKALEEPPDGTFFILVSALPNAILATLRSRSQLVRFKPLSDESLKRILGRSQEIEPPSLPAAKGAAKAPPKKVKKAAAPVDDWLLRASQGSVEKALRLLDDREEFEALETATTNYLTGALKGFPGEEIANLRELLKDRTTHGFVAGVIQSAVTDAMKLKSGLKPASLRLSPEKSSFKNLLEPLAKKPAATLDRLARRSLDFEADLARNVDRGLLLEALAIDLLRP